MKKDTNLCKELDSVSRRKAVKKIVGGVSALAAYNMLPVRWDKPIIEQVFLPAHAQTSGAVATCDGCSLEDPCTITILDGHQFSDVVVVQVGGNVTPPTAGLPVSIILTPLNVSKAALSDPASYQTVTDAQGMFSGTYTVAGGPGIEEVSAVTRVDGANGPGECSASTHVQPERNNQSGSGRTQTVSSSASNVSLPDRVNINIDMPVTSGLMTITKVTLALNITHTYDGDLVISLTSPDGTSRTLFSNVCSYYDNMSILLDDDASSQIGTGCGSPYTGTFHTNGNLNAFNGEDPNGTWVLNINDTFGGDSGNLNQATLTVTAD